MDYRFKLNAFKQPETLHLSGQVLCVLDEDGQVLREMELGEIQKIREYESFKGIDPTSGAYPIKYCKLTVKQGKTLCIRNGFYTGNYGRMGDMATNQEAAYATFMTELKRSVANVSPDTPIVYGWLLASLCWWAVALLGIGFLALGIGGFILDTFGTALALAVFCFPVGGIMLFSGAQLGWAYWPKRTTAKKFKSSLTTGM